MCHQLNQAILVEKEEKRCEIKMAGIE